jgi:hypothetical protein
MAVLGFLCSLPSPLLTLRVFLSLNLLGTLRTRNPEAHRVLIRYLQDLESYVADAAVLALAAIGKATAPHLP